MIIYNYVINVLLTKLSVHLSRKPEKENKQESAFQREKQSSGNTYSANYEHPKSTF